MEFCPHCIRPASGEVCTNCGGQIHWTAAPGQLPVGALLRGAGGHTYQIGAARGQGGFGITYAAMNLTSGERVAIKEYYPTRCALRSQLSQVMPMTGQNEIYQGGMKSFLEEAMMLAAVGALPSVVSVKDYFEANGTAYLVMEYVDGIPLHQVVARQGKMTAAELLPKLPALLNDLDVLHKAGVIHRDISPDNLILMPDGKLKLLDFGSARSVQDGKSMTILLKAGFSPVEQYQSRGQGPWTDVYALAGTIYYCLTGVIPPSAVDRLDVDSLQKPNALGAGLTVDQEEALVWGLVVQPKARPASMELFQKRLFPEPICGGRDCPLPPVDPFSKLKDTVADMAHTAKNATKEALHNAQDATKDVIKNAKETFANKTNRPSEDTGTVEPEIDPPISDDAPVNPTEGIEDPPVTVPGQEATHIPYPPKSRINRKKKILKFVLFGLVAVIALIIVGIGIFYLATHGTTADGYGYRLKVDSYAVITDYEGDGGNITLPEEIRNLPVRYIDDYAFAYHDEITSITVANGVHPFSDVLVGCDGITTVVFDMNKSSASSVSWWESDLKDCENLRCILFTKEETYGASLEKEYLAELDSVVLCYKGQDTGFGRIKSVEIIDDVVYAITDEKNAVVLQMPEGMDGDSLSATLGLYQVLLPDGRVPGWVEPDPEPISGETDDGYSYYISADRSECMITGYSGNDAVLIIPEEIDGHPVNIIDEKAFAGNTSFESVFLPYTLESIRDSAFSGCNNLRDIYIYSNCSASISAFASCPRFCCAVIESKEYWPLSWTLPSDFHIYITGMETGIGQLSYVYVADDETIYGVTVDDRAVVLDIPDDVTELYLQENVFDMPVEWVYEGALDGLSEEAVIWLPEQTAFACEQWDNVDWSFANAESAFTFAECWWYSCVLCEMTREERGTTTIDVDRALTSAAMKRAEEMKQSNSNTRPNGEKWSTILDEYGVEWSYAATRINTIAYDDSVSTSLFEFFEQLAEKYAAPEESNDNKYYDHIGIGMYFDTDTDEFYLCCLTTMSN